MLFLNCQTGHGQWKNLIKGNRLDGWHTFKSENSSKGWMVEDEALNFNGLSNMESGEGEASLLSDWMNRRSMVMRDGTISVSSKWDVFVFKTFQEKFGSKIFG